MLSGPGKSIVIDSPGAQDFTPGKAAKNLAALVWDKRAWLGFFVIAVVLYLGWQGRNERNITAEDGLGYALGIIGASMMATLLIYPLRKRIRFLKVLGPTRHWFRIHMMLGIGGPVLILYHSNFTVSSLNSRVALFCTLLVAGSGIVGRYLYSKIHNGLYGEKTSLRSLVKEMQKSMDEIPVDASSEQAIREQLLALDQAVLEPPDTLVSSMLRPFRFWVLTRRTWYQLKRDVQMTPDTLRELRRHMNQVRRIAHLSFYDRLFSLWHILHLPFFFMLVLSAIVHIFAVHMY